MENDELCLKVIDDLGNNYILGLHHVNKEIYKFKSQYDNEKFNIMDSYLNETNIINSILKKGLFVPYDYIGLESTVTLVNKIVPDIFNYAYYSDVDDKIYVVVIAIPKYISINGDNSFVIDTLEYVRMSNCLLFSKLLPKEFIFGYYVKDVIHRPYGDNLISSSKLIFDDKVKFYSNDRFYGYLSLDEQNKFISSYFDEYVKDIFLFKKVDGIEKIRVFLRDTYEYCLLSSTKRRLLKTRKK